MKVSEILLLVFAAVIGAATFIENDYGTQTARALVYKAHWFEALLFVFIAAVIYNIYRYQMYARPKWGQLILHVAFVWIAIGAAVTRYVGYEGVLLLRNGQISDTMVSDHMVLTAKLIDANGGVEYDSPMYLSSMTRNHLDETLKLGQKQVHLRLTRYIPSAEKKEGHYITGALKPGGRYPQIVSLDVTHAGVTHNVDLEGYRAQPGKPVIVSFDDMRVELSYGAKVIKLPFAVRLDRFKLDRYPGSMMPSSYESYVTIEDTELNTTFAYHIYMNHVLSYRGYRFFQSSYDPDEQGSILSVNHDPGTLPTYIGYVLLLIGFIWGFLSPKGRLTYLRKKLHKLKSASPSVVLAVVIWSSSGILMHAEDQVDLSPVRKISQAHAMAFGRLVVQDSGGRMKPMDTYAREILSKISRKNSWRGLSAEQVILGMLTQPSLFQRVR